MRFGSIPSRHSAVVRRRSSIAYVQDLCCDLMISVGLRSRDRRMTRILPSDSQGRCPLPPWMLRICKDIASLSYDSATQRCAAATL